MQPLAAWLKKHKHAGAFDAISWIFSMLAPNPSAPLNENFDHQDDRFASALSILQEAITHRAFPAASIAVTYRGQLVALKALGHLIYEAPSKQITAGAPPFSRSLREEPALKIGRASCRERGLLEV